MVIILRATHNHRLQAGSYNTGILIHGDRLEGDLITIACKQAPTTHASQSMVIVLRAIYTYRLQAGSYYAGISIHGDRLEGYL